MSPFSKSGSLDTNYLSSFLKRSKLSFDVTAEILNGHITAETSKRICCDSKVIPILSGKMGEPLDIGRKTRTIPPAMRRALNMRDQGCRFPGCTHRYYGLATELLWDREFPDD